MASMIEEADDVSQPLLDVILECVTSPKMKEQPQAYRSQPPALHAASRRVLQQGKKRKDATRWHETNEKPSIIPRCPG